MRAYTMVTAKLARPGVLARIKERTGFNGLEVYGMYDIVVEAEAESIRDLHRRITEIDKMSMVQDTLTFVVVQEGRVRKDTPDTFAYILVDALPGYIQEVQDQISELEEVRKVDIVFGPFDLIVDIGVESIEELNDSVRRIIAMEPVLRTRTLISFKRSAG